MKLPFSGHHLIPDHAIMLLCRETRVPVALKQVRRIRCCEGLAHTTDGISFRGHLSLKVVSQKVSYDSLTDTLDVPSKVSHSAKLRKVYSLHGIRGYKNKRKMLLYRKNATTGDTFLFYIDENNKICPFQGFQLRSPERT
jgi:hypothetical protein